MAARCPASGGTPGRVVTLLLAAVLGIAAPAGCAGHSAPQPTDRAVALSAARAFLATYVDPDGRVVRRDQGGDTVSEGQGYALLLAVAVSDRGAVGRIWDWTRTHLQRPDALLSYLWRDGAVADPSPAADADTQVAWALTLAGARFGVPTWTADARRLAGAAAELEVGYDDSGAPLLAAGPFGAGGKSTPAVAEPGYWAAPAMASLARLTGDRRWQDMGPSHARLLADLTGAGARLPADWVQVGAGGGARPVPAPSGGASVRCALDGQRALVWAALDPSTRALAGRWWLLVDATAAAAPLARRLDGGVLQADATPLGAVAAAAAAGAAGRPGDAAALLTRADAVAAKYPSYYGQAWAALGRVLLTTDLLAA